jgi:hypothetical protein
MRVKRRKEILKSGREGRGVVSMLDIITVSIGIAIIVLDIILFCSIWKTNRELDVTQERVKRVKRDSQ